MSTASDIVAGLGGQENITDLEPCITRLRVEVADQTKVDEEALRAAGAFGVVRSGRVVQVVVGPTADSLASEIAASLTDCPVPGRSAQSPGSSTCNVEPGDLPFPAQRSGACRGTGPDLAVCFADRRLAARSWTLVPRAAQRQWRHHAASR